MKTVLICLTAICLFCISCKKENNIIYCKAIVNSIHDISCGIPLLDFSEDSIAIRRLTGNTSIKYTVIGLPDTLNMPDKKLYVSVTTLKPEEDFPCNTLGISYPHLKIVFAKER